MTGLPHVFSEVRASVATRRAWRLLGWGHLLVAMVLAVDLPGRFFLSSLLLTATSALLNSWPRYRRSAFALAASFSTFVYFVLPLAFIGRLGAGYEFGRGLAAVPAENVEYHQAAPAAIAFLALMIVAAACGLASAAPRRVPGLRALTRGLKPDLAIGVLAVIVLLFTSDATQALLKIRLSGTETAESLWQFIFFDSAFLMLLPIVLWMRLGPMRPANHRLVELQFALILGVFVLQATLGSTSKGFLLTLFIMTVVMPLSYAQSSSDVRCLLPSRLTMSVGAILAVFLFVVAESLRVSVYTGESQTGAGVVDAMQAQANSQQLLAGLSTIGYRISVAFDRYVVIFQAFLYRGVSMEYAGEFGRYVAKNFVNMVLPGSPFPEAYMPSSNLLPSILAGEPLNGASTKADLIRGLNTQPQTMFGVGVILMGRYAPIFVAALCGLLAFAYRVVRSVPVRLGLIYLFFSVVQSFGIEIAVANAIHLVVSLFIFVWLLRTWRWLRRWIRHKPVHGGPSTVGVQS